MADRKWIPRFTEDRREVDMWRLKSDAGATGGGILRPATKVVSASNSIDLNNADYVCDGANDEVQIQAAMTAVNAAGGGDVLLMEGTYSIGASITGKSHVHVKGMGSLPYWGNGTTLSLDANVPMFAFAGATYGWGFSNIKFDGNDRAYPAIDCHTESGAPADTRGCYNVHFVKCQFEYCIPAIYAINAWDWWFTDCSFKYCGDYGGASAHHKAAIYVVNTAYGGGLGAFSNHWHIQGCTGTLDTAPFIWSHYDSVYVNPNAFFCIMGCDFEGGYDDGTAYEFIYGTLAHSRIIGNYINNQNTLRPQLWLVGNSGKGVGNRIIGNDFRTASDTDGSYMVRTSNWLDVITSNIFFGQSKNEGQLLLDTTSYRCRVISNTRLSSSDLLPFCDDDGKQNTVICNEGDGTDCGGGATGGGGSTLTFSLDEADYGDMLVGSACGKWKPLHSSEDDLVLTLKQGLPTWQADISANKDAIGTWAYVTLVNMNKSHIRFLAEPRSGVGTMTINNDGSWSLASYIRESYDSAYSQGSVGPGTWTNEGVGIYKLVAGNYHYRLVINGNIGVFYLESLYDTADRGFHEWGIMMRGIDFTALIADLDDNLTTATRPTGTIKGVLATKSNTQAIVNATWTAVQWNATTYDMTPAFWVVGASTRLTIPYGVTQVKVGCTVMWDASSTGVRAVTAYKNGAAFVGNPYDLRQAVGYDLFSIVSPTISVVKDDYFELMVYQTSGGNLNIGGSATFCYFYLEVVA